VRPAKSLLFARWRPVAKVYDAERQFTTLGDSVPTGLIVDLRNEVSIAGLSFTVKACEVPSKNLARSHIQDTYALGTEKFAGTRGKKPVNVHTSPIRRAWRTSPVGAALVGGRFDVHFPSSSGRRRRRGRFAVASNHKQQRDDAE
jgi:hypothetical protein